jgi:CBS domain-containing protein
MVIENDHLLGIVTERDIVFRVVANVAGRGHHADQAVMTAAPETLAPDDTAATALEKMQAGGYRHLPVMRDGEVCGMVSIRDIYEAVRRMLQEELQ